MIAYARRLVVVALASVLLAGCGFVVRYSWSGGDADQLQAAHQECVREANLPPVNLAPRAAQLGVYKTCLEKLGYTKSQTERIPPRAEVCGQSNQTCLFENQTWPQPELRAGTGR